MNKHIKANFLSVLRIYTLAPVIVIVYLLTAALPAHAQEGYDGGIERTQVARISDFTTADTALPLQLHYVQDNSSEVSKKIRNIITLSINEETPLFVPGSFSANVRLRIYYGHAGYTEHYLDTSLTVTYNNTAGVKYNPKAYISLNSAEYLQVNILSINAPLLNSSFNTRQLLCLQNEMQVTRYYQLANNVQPVSVTAVPDATDPLIPDELDINWQWPQAAGNNYTQLEWTWLEDEFAGNYTDGSGNVKTTLLFKHNATRVDLSLNTVAYGIPLFYDGVGKLYYRIRPVNITASGTQITGPWSVYTYAFGGHNNNLNWQGNTSFAEEGKRKTVIQYYDGSLRSRQTVTKDNTTGTTITAETFYDGQGRPAIQVLPAPGINNIVSYRANLNRFNGQPINCNPDSLFDLQPVHSSDPSTPAMINSSGASQYYSALNPEIADSINKNIPDASGYPYSVTRYTPDATGRILYQCSVGDSLKMGSGHETKYYYGTPAQEELDGLFGTDVGDYTHYFQNMAQDANGQMSVSYVDMHGRTIATALAGDAPASLDTLDIHNGNDYTNQEQITRNLLDSSSNILKDGKIESVSSILASATTTFHFNYHFPTNILQLTSCNGTTLTYNCIYNLAITVTDESGNSAPVVLNYSSGINNTTITDSLTLPVGSYSVRKTLTIDQATLQQDDSSYMQVGNGFCKYQQDIIDSVSTAMETQSGCGQPPVVVTCQSCLANLGTFGAFDTAYAGSLGIAVSALTTNQQTEIRNEYVNDSTHCQMLNSNISHTLDNIKTAMLADMMPYTGQYALDPDLLGTTDNGSYYKGTMYSKYNIFASINSHIPTPGLFYKRPLTGAVTNWSVYNNSQGLADPTIPQSVLDTMSDDTYESIYNPSWAAAMLPYHPEYGELVFAQQNLQSSYDWQERFNNVTTYSQAADSGYISNIIANDPFFSLPNTSSYQSLMTTYLTGHWQDNLSMWQMAYGSAVCASKYNVADSLGHCSASVPATPPYSNISTSQQDQLWTTFAGFYEEARNEMINSYIAQSSPGNPDRTTLINQHYILHFTASNSELAQQNKWTWYNSTPGAPPNVNIKDSANTLMQGRCVSYVPNWQQQLLQCSTLANEPSATQTAILNAITSRMEAVCQQGTDDANPYGSSDIPSGATPANSYGDTSFEQIVNSVYASYGISKDEYCNPYVITFPKPYNKNPLFVHQVATAVDTCNCKQFAQILINANASGVDISSLSALNVYLNGKYNDTLTAGMFAGLQHCSDLGKIRGGLTPDTVTKVFYVTTSVISNMYQSNFEVAVPDTVSNKLVTGYYAPPQPFQVATFFRFDSVSTLPTNRLLLSATMKFYADSSGYDPSPLTPVSDTLNTGDTLALFFGIPNNQWDPHDASTINPLFGSGDGASIPQPNLFPRVFPMQDLTFDATNYVNFWQFGELVTDTGLVAFGNTGIELQIWYASSGTVFPKDAAFYSNRASDPTKRPTLTVTYIVDTLLPYDTAMYYFKLPQAQPLPQFLQCGFDLNSGPNCYSCSQLASLTAQFKTEFTGLPDAAAPLFTTANPDTNTIKYNTLYAEYINYKTGMQYSWAEYGQAVNANGCNLSNGVGTAGSVICATTTALTDTTGLNIIQLSPCDQTDAFAIASAQNIYQLRTQKLLTTFDSAYLAQAASVQEQFTVTYTPKEYHYTLYYYDEAGNLVKTVPPKGVHPDFDKSFTDAVEADKKTGTQLVPVHTYTTNYRYNTLNQVVAQRTPDAGTTHFWYDRLGRLVISQNAKQALSSYVAPDGATGPAYSYTLYDSLGRITEVGEKPQTTGMTQIISRDSTLLKSWLSASGSKEQITHTVYDTAYAPINGILLTQQNLRNRISYSMTKNVETDNLQYAATYYTYDVHGNVDTLVQDYLGLAAMNNTQNRFKTIAYTYDLISGKVNTVDYQPGKVDAFHHIYEYDAENRITNVLTSRDSIVWQQQVVYGYYKHGPLARTVLGQLQVQGIDYSYTLQGWLKGVNNVFGGNEVLSNGTGCTSGTGLDSIYINSRWGNTPNEYAARHLIEFDQNFASGNYGDSLHTNLNTALSPCQVITDAGAATGIAFASELPPVANDAYGFSLHYYPGDYNPIAGTSNTGVLGVLGSAASPLFNGNIAAMVVNIPILGSPLMENFRYDQLNRLVSMDAYNGLNATTGNFTPVKIDDYKERYSYDPDGSIQTLLRHGQNKTIDSAAWNYYPGMHRLNNINDPAGRYGFDAGAQSANNYQYDSIGEMTSDAERGLTNITWNIYGKVLQQTSSNGTTITFSYDASNNCISKTVSGSGNDYSEFYVRDVVGNILCIYRNDNTGFKASEYELYGSSRLGKVDTLTVKPYSIALSSNFGNAALSVFTRGEAKYELVDHRGNVMAIVSDKKLAVDNNNDGYTDAFNADLINAQQYSSFGSLLDGQQYGNTPRFTYNGKQLDKETGWQEYGMRNYLVDEPIFAAVDPLTKKYPELTPYQFASNTPICAVDLDGEESKIVTTNLWSNSEGAILSSGSTIENAGNPYNLGDGVLTITNYEGVRGVQNQIRIWYEPTAGEVWNKIKQKIFDGMHTGFYEFGDGGEFGGDKNSIPVGSIDLANKNNDATLIFTVFGAVTTSPWSKVDIHEIPFAVPEKTKDYFDIKLDEKDEKDQKDKSSSPTNSSTNTKQKPSSGTGTIKQPKSSANKSGGVSPTIPDSITIHVYRRDGIIVDGPDSSYNNDSPKTVVNPQK